jgi:hypothetical protein
MDWEKPDRRFDGNDVKVTTATDDAPVTVLDLLSELIECGERESERPLILAERNEKFVNGDQASDLDFSGQFVDIRYEGSIPNVHHNLLRNLVLAWTSRLLKDRPTCKAWPSTDEPEDVAASQVATSLIEDFERRHDFDKMLQRILRNACPHGTGAMKIFYDPELDMVEWHPITVFDYYIDPAEDVRDAKWVVFQDYVSMHEAKAIIKRRLKKKKVDENDIAVETYDASGLERKGVPVFEIWHLPDSRIPNGLFASVVGGNVVETSEYPYVFQQDETPAEPLVDPDTGMPVFDKKGQPKMSDAEASGGYAMLPIAIFKVDDKRASPYGETWVTDAVPLQKIINEHESILLKIRRDSAAVKLLGPKSVIDDWNEDNQAIAISDPEKAAMIRWVDPPKVSQILFNERDQYERRLYDIAGLNEVLAGVESTKSGTSAKQIAYLSELDAMKHSGTAKNIESFILRIFQITLELVQRYYQLPRIIRMVGEDEEIQAVSFVGADIQGSDIKLEPRSGIDRFSAQKQANKKEEAVQGLRDPASAMMEGERGTDSTGSEYHMVDMVKQQVQSVLQGQPPQPDPRIDADIAIQVIEDIYFQLRSQNHDPQRLMVVMDLLHAYKQMHQQNQHMAKPQGTRPKGAASYDQQFAKDEQKMRNF